MLPLNLKTFFGIHDFSTGIAPQPKNSSMEGQAIAPQPKDSSME
ncbi:unnamed protein product [Arabidopsis lyrata]|nr:unnamed protein product [Arabidopsis lyrata]